MSDDEQPRRREVDRDRRRWNDQALDQLDTRVDDVENIAAALAGLPDRVLGLKDAVDQMRLTQRDAAGLEERRIVSVREDIGALRTRLDERLDVVDAAHEAAAARGVDWKTVLAVAATVAVPLAVAVISTFAR